MIELVDHPAYKLIKKYGESMVVDYVILKNLSGIHDSHAHKQAAIEAITIIARRRDEYAYDKIKNNPRCKNMKRKDFSMIKWNQSKMHAEEYSTEQFFVMPKEESDKNILSDCKSYGEYAHAFLEPPYSNKYDISDWQELNSILFSSKENLKIYKWNTEWSNYFNDGLEWWGAYFWTIYDSESDIFIVVAASTTD